MAGIRSFQDALEKMQIEFEKKEKEIWEQGQMEKEEVLTRLADAQRRRRMSVRSTRSMSTANIAVPASGENERRPSVGMSKEVAALTETISALQEQCAIHEEQCAIHEEEVENALERISELEALNEKKESEKVTLQGEYDQLTVRITELKEESALRQVDLESAAVKREEQLAILAVQCGESKERAVQCEESLAESLGVQERMREQIGMLCDEVAQNRYVARKSEQLMEASFMKHQASLYLCTEKEKEATALAEKLEGFEKFSSKVLRGLERRCERAGLMREDFRSQLAWLKQDYIHLQEKAAKLEIAFHESEHDRVRKTTELEKQTEHLPSKTRIDLCLSQCFDHISALQENSMRRAMDKEIEVMRAASPEKCRSSPEE